MLIYLVVYLFAKSNAYTNTGHYIHEDKCNNIWFEIFYIGFFLSGNARLQFGMKGFFILIGLAFAKNWRDFVDEDYSAIKLAFEVAEIPEIEEKVPIMHFPIDLVWRELWKKSSNEINYPWYLKQRVSKAPAARAKSSAGQRDSRQRWTSQHL